MKPPAVVVRLALLLTGLTSLAIPTFAQLPPGLRGLTCAVEPVTAATLRSEGLSELMSDIGIRCTGGTPTPKGQPIPTIDISVRLSTAAANRPVSQGTPFLDSYILLDEPAPADQRLARTVTASLISPDGTAQIIGEDGSFKGYLINVFHATQTNVNTVTFRSVPLEPRLTADIGRRFAIKNLRGVGERPWNGLAANYSVTADVSIRSGGVAIPVTNASRTVGNVQQGLRTSLTTNSATGCLSFNTAIAPNSVANPNDSNYSLLTFRAGFPGAFKPRLVVSGPSAPGSAPGSTPFSEAGYVAPGTFPHTIPGTRLRATFNGVPPGVRLFVENLNALQAARGVLVSPPIAAGSQGLTQIPIVNGVGTAVWEVTNANPDIEGALRFGVWTQFAGSPASPIPPTPLTVNMTFDPLDPFPTNQVGFDAGVETAPRFTDPFQSADPKVPSFHDLVFFNILSCGTGPSQLTNLPLDTRPCLPGADIGISNNACTAPALSQAFLNIVSDRTAVSPVVTATPDGGVSLNPQLTSGGPLTGTTPMVGTVFINATNARPGTYRPFLTVSAPGAGNTLTIPYTVTVPGPNTPIITPQGMDDAATFGWYIIHPGQIFTTFGSKFGVPGVEIGVLTEGKLPKNIGGGVMTFDNVAAPLLYMANGQLAGVAPFSLAGKTSTQVQLTYNGNTSPAITLPVTPSSIAILSADGSGGGGGAIFNSDNTLNTPDNPAAAGSQVTIYGTYSGPMTVPGTDGRTTTGEPYPKPSGPVAVFFGGVQAGNVAYFGNSPTLLESVIQANVTIPSTVKPSPAVPVQLSAGGATSPPWTTIAVK